ncbi:MAG: lysophospholipid acyltransferase family protein [Rhodothermales bacterium]
MLVARLRFLIAFIISACATLLFGVGFLLANAVAPGPALFTRWARGWARTCMLSAGIRVSVVGADNLPKGGQCVFVANHQSALDIPAVLVGIPASFGFVAKRALSQQPIVGAVLRASPSVFVDGTRPRETIESVREAAAQIESGNSVLVFPEGERTWSRNLVELRKRAFILAAQAGVPVVPVTIMNAHKLVDERRYVAYSGRVELRVDPPVLSSDDSLQSVRYTMERVRAIFEQNLAQGAEGE